MFRSAMNVIRRQVVDSVFKRPIPAVRRLTTLNAESKERIVRVTSFSSVAVLFGAFGYAVYKDHVKEDVYDKSILRNPNYQNHGDVVPADHLTQIGNSPAAGRSGAHLVQDDKGDYFYRKKMFTRDQLLKELLISAVAHHIFGDKAPRACAVEEPGLNGKHASSYSFMSQSIGGADGNMNLEDWAVAYAQGAIDIVPEFLGEAVAFDMLFGNSDTKLANIIIITKGERAGHCYSVDHEKALHEMPVILKSGEMGLAAIVGEFRKKGFTEYLMEQGSDGVLDTNENVYQPLKKDGAIKAKIKPILEMAIQRDIDNGNVRAFYENFVKLSISDFDHVFDHYGSLVHDADRKYFDSAILQRQAVAREFLQLHAHDGQLSQRRPGL